MSTVLNIHEAKTNLSKLLSKVMQGEEVIISKQYILDTHTFLWAIAEPESI
ncbi:MAG TPA: type II toxin-antitoxin system prevent-host-death family antitoxin [Leptospiraceae bacterium]|nr:type II toxin-antitoxin system prevent-host-death family antitoxin [Leptospiraceae bacterium]HMW07499.1 type II toxin-antitoxin system prevent-host-death family antitoxin [Leptospiraceae bacterium]HMX33113.1 type II toxin-antitoxin system prevent-host-death family antitoxin [Leptospiraceae bacterium]HMY33107.1 type II toxin-antitoxin system prevent-host-death family antitoxin [Leptospiraceae bacterium]HMZ64232.1 type II toxin-antitoxin system prevent-host-death family antitoxin [Leptospirace